MGNKKSCDVDIEPKGDAALYIHEDACVITYLQTSGPSWINTQFEHN
jgi:hypothetical protein